MYQSNLIATTNEILSVIGELRATSIPTDPGHSIIDGISMDSSQLTKMLNKYGYCVIKCCTSNRHNINKLIECTVGKYIEQNKLGIKEAVIAPREDSTSYVQNRKFQPLHQDSAYLDNTPEFVVLNCKQNCLRGGETLIFDINQHAGKMNWSTDEIFDHDAQIFLSYNIKKPLIIRKRDKYCSYISPFASDIKFKSEGVKNIFLDIVSAMNNPNNIYRVKLSPGDFIIINNKQVAHGRTRFWSSERKLLRYWI